MTACVKVIVSGCTPKSLTVGVVAPTAAEAAQHTWRDEMREMCASLSRAVNMPGAVARTSTIALGNATMPFMLALADKGWKQACADDPHLKAGLNVHAGQLTYAAVAEALGMEAITADQAIAG